MKWPESGIFFGEDYVILVYFPHAHGTQEGGVSLTLNQEEALK